MAKNIIIAVLATIVVGFTALLIYGLSLEEETNTYIPPSLVQSDVQYDSTTDTFKKEYMAGCDTDGTYTSYCACTWDYLSSRYTLSQMAQMGLDYERTGELTNEMYEAASACL